MTPTYRNVQGCELPSDAFMEPGNDGPHVCDSDGFRRSYCEACDDVIESEGLCGHGAYPDGCCAADDVIVIEWRHDSDDAHDWQTADDSRNNPAIFTDRRDLYERRKLRGAIVDVIARVFADCTSGGLEDMTVSDDTIPAGLSGCEIEFPLGVHADGRSVIVCRARRGSLGTRQVLA